MLSIICVATTTGLPDSARGAGDLLLDARHLSNGHLDAESPLATIIASARSTISSSPAPPAFLDLAHSRRRGRA